MTEGSATLLPGTETPGLGRQGWGSPPAAGRAEAGPLHRALALHPGPAGHRALLHSCPRACAAQLRGNCPLPQTSSLASPVTWAPGGDGGQGKGAVPSSPAGPVTNSREWAVVQSGGFSQSKRARGVGRELEGPWRVRKGPRGCRCTGRQVAEPGAGVWSGAGDRNRGAGPACLPPPPPAFPHLHLCT